MSGKVILPVLCLSIALNLAFGGLYARRKIALDASRGEVGRGGEESGDGGEPRKVAAGSAAGTKKTSEPPLRGRRRARCILEELELTGPQRKKLERMRSVIWKKRDRFHAEIDDLRRKVARAIARAEGAEGREGAGEREQIGELVAEMSRKQSAFRMEVVAHLLRVKEMLTPAQRAHFARLLEKKIFSGMRRGASRGALRGADGRASRGGGADGRASRGGGADGRARRLIRKKRERNGSF
jgi:Spy/CpxP family protein refolding chaperone